MFSLHLKTGMPQDGVFEISLYIKHSTLLFPCMETGNLSPNSSGSMSKQRSLWCCHISDHQGNIKNNAWGTVNNDFWVTSEAICQWFSRVTKSRVKIIGKSHHEWPKFVIHGNECIILFLTRYFMSLEHTILRKNIINRSFRNCRQGRPFLTSHCDVTKVDLWREILALWRHIRRLFLHAQIGAKAIFTSE